MQLSLPNDSLFNQTQNGTFESRRRKAVEGTLVAGQSAVPADARASCECQKNSLKRISLIVRPRGLTSFSCPSTFLDSTGSLRQWLNRLPSQRSISSGRILRRDLAGDWLGDALKEPRYGSFEQASGAHEQYSSEPSRAILTLFIFLGRKP